MGSEVGPFIENILDQNLRCLVGEGHTCPRDVVEAVPTGAMKMQSELLINSLK